MSEPDTVRPQEPPRKRSVLLLALLLLPLVFMTDANWGLLIFGSSVVLILVTYAFWAYRKTVWMWAAVAWFALVHALLITLLGDVVFTYRAIAIPLFLADFMALGLLMVWIGNAFNRRGKPKAD